MAPQYLAVLHREHCLTGVFVNDFKQLEHVGRTRTEEEEVEEVEKEGRRTCCVEDMVEQWVGERVEIIPMKHTNTN